MLAAREESPMAVAMREGDLEEEIEGAGGGGGLLSETIKKVDRAFKSRLTQLSGPGDDLGYQYFVEKVYAHVVCSVHVIIHVHVVLHPADEGQKPETAVQDLHFLSFGTAHLIFDVLYVQHYIHVRV